MAIAPDFDDPICEGTLAMLDEHVETTERATGDLRDDERILVYWLRGGVSDRCGDEQRGCFFPGTRIVMAQGPSIQHELVHAVIDSEGESFFVEEGLAEVLSGAGVVFDALDDASAPSSNLRISRSKYNDGGVDYAEATHFVHYIRAELGEGGLRNLATEVAKGASASDIEDLLKLMFDRSLGDFENVYLSDDTKQRYRGLAEANVEEVQEVDYRLGINRRLDCDEPETRGPLWNDEGGMFQVVRVDVPRPGISTLYVTGDVGGWVMLFDPDASLRRRRLSDWNFPDPEVDPDHIVIPVGSRVDTHLSRGTYLAIFGSNDPETPIDVGLRVELPSDPPPEQEAIPN